MSALAVSQPRFPAVARRYPFEWTVVIAAVLLGGLAVVMLVDGAPRDAVDRSVRELLIIWVPVAAGLHAMRTPSGTRLGRLLIGVGFAWSLTALAESSASVPYSLGRVAAWLIFPMLMYAILAFPEGRLVPGVDRALYSGINAAIAALFIGSALFVQAYPASTPWAACTTDCPANAFLVLDAEPSIMKTVVEPFRQLLTVALMLGVTSSLLRRMRSATRLRRQQIAPVTLASVGSCMTLAAYMVVRQYSPESSAVDTLGTLWSLWIPTLAAAFAVGGVRRRMMAARVLERLSVALDGPLVGGSLRAALATALGDPHVELLIQDGSSAGWSDSRGRSTSPAAAAEPGYEVTLLGDPRAPDAALIHDAALRADDELVMAVGSLVHSALRHRQLECRLQRSLTQLDDSRKRLLTAADLERSQIERDLHDGAQQRLIMLRIKLSLAEELLRTDPVAGRKAVNELASGIEAALEELRSLAHGVYPPLLSDRGLGDALRGVVSQSAFPVHLELRGLTRQPADIETAVYFICVEALQNAVKHARGATAVWISVHQDRALTFEVRDDGGGFDLSGREASRGLSNMRDRADAVGGRLTVDTSPGRGTRIIGSVPIGSRRDRAHARA